MNQEHVINKVKHILHSLREKIHHEDKQSETTKIDFELNEYDKMRLESLMKNELQYKARAENMIKPPGNNRDISAI